jgi:beta-lactamase class A
VWQGFNLHGDREAGNGGELRACANRKPDSTFMSKSRLRAAAAIAAALAVAAGCRSASGSNSPASQTPSTFRPVTTSNTAGYPTTPALGSSSTRIDDSAPPKPRNYGAELDRAVAALPTGSVSVAAVNLKTGERISGGSTRGQWMASTYKLFLTEAWLAESDSDSESDADADAEAAIEQSDNAAGYRLYLALGGTPGTIAAFHRFGLTHTELPGNAYDPTFVTTSAADWIHVLRSLVTPGELTASQRKYVLSLMEQVEPDQRWGVGAAATGWFVNKNGWETVDSTNTPPEPADGGRWIVNSVGIVTRHGQRLLMAVLTQHNADRDTGIHLVERLAKLAAAAVT